jgi:hypothetical protein
VVRDFVSLLTTLGLRACICSFRAVVFVFGLVIDGSSGSKKEKKKKGKEKRFDCSIEAPTGCYLRFWGTCSGGL